MSTISKRFLNAASAVVLIGALASPYAADAAGNDKDTLLAKKPVGATTESPHSSKGHSYMPGELTHSFHFDVGKLAGIAEDKIFFGARFRHREKENNPLRPEESVGHAILGLTFKF